MYKVEFTAGDADARLEPEAPRNFPFSKQIWSVEFQNLLTTILLIFGKPQKTVIVFLGVLAN